MMARCVFGGLSTRSGLRDTHRADALGCPSPSVVIRPPLSPPHFFDRHTLAVVSFADSVGHNCSGNARRRTPLQQTAIQRGLSPRWPRLSSQIAGVSKKRQRFLCEEEAFSGNTVQHKWSTLFDITRRPDESIILQLYSNLTFNLKTMAFNTKRYAYIVLQHPLPCREI